MNKIELLAPAGNFEKLKTAFDFGADAVYLAGKKYGLRAFADNFDTAEMKQACDYSHKLGKKVYCTVNVFAHNADFDDLAEYLHDLENAGVDAVIVSDVGVFDFVKANSSLPIHVSTQANTTNKWAVKHWSGEGASRVVLAREVSLADVKKIHEFCPETELETFVHGAMCVSYSGRCLLSNYLTNRDSNHGECVQACRWQWEVNEVSRADEKMPVEEDERGTYIFNSKDMNMLCHLGELIDAGVTSFKIEGRMKSAFYVATVVNAYRRALDMLALGKINETKLAELYRDLDKASHRAYTTGFYLDDQNRQYYPSSRAVEEYKFIAVVKAVNGDGTVTVEQRNKFVVGDTLELLSRGDDFNKTFTVDKITDTDGNSVEVANVVQQTLVLKCPLNAHVGDILRRAENPNG